MKQALATLGLGVITLLIGTSMVASNPEPPKLVSTPLAHTDKVMVIVLENHALKQIQKDAPYTYSLGQHYGMATNATAATHPSKPNYAVMAAGEQRGITSDSAKRVRGQSVFGATIAAGRSAKTMAESMGTDRCRHTSTKSKGYVEKHNPQEFYSDETALCEKYNFDYGKYGAGDIANGKLGNVEFLIPNQCNNAHDCSLGTFDRWLKVQLTKVAAGPDWRSGRLTIIVTADEDDKKNSNVIPMIVIHPALSHKVVTSKLTLGSLNRLLTDFGHAPHMGQGKTAPDMAVAFGLDIQ